MPQGKHEPHGNRPFAFLHQLAGHIIDRGNMVSIHRMTKSKTVGKKRGAQQHREMAQGKNGPQPGRSVEDQQDAVDAEHLASGVAGCVAEQRPQDRSHAIRVDQSIHRNACFNLDAPLASRPLIHW